MGSYSRGGCQSFCLSQPTTPTRPFTPLAGIISFIIYGMSTLLLTLRVSN